MITVLGASGFIGRHLVERLQSLGIEHINPGREEDLSRRNLGDVIYSIGLTSDFRSKPFDTINAHVCKLQEILQECQFESLLYLSSARVYGTQAESASEDSPLQIAPLDPDHLYNISKLMGESLALNCGKKTRVSRLSNVYGDDFDSDNFLSSIIKDAITSGNITLRAFADSEKDYISVKDAVDCLIRIATGGRRRIYNVASGINISHRQLTEKISELTGCQIHFDAKPQKISFPLINIDRIRTEFNFQPSCVLEDMRALVNSYKNRYEGQG